MVEMMMNNLQEFRGARQAHPWLRQQRLAFVPGPTTPLLDRFVKELLQRFRAHRHTLLEQLDGEQPDLLLTTAAFGEPLNWREAMIFSARRRYRLAKAPTVYTLLHATPAQLQNKLDHFAIALRAPTPNPADFEFPGLSPRAYHTLYEQGRRGGPILSLVRLLQAQAMSIRLILVIGEDQPLYAYTFDLVGAHPRTEASNPDLFYEDLMLRIVTANSTHEITEHQVVGDPVPQATWRKMRTPEDMRVAGRELGQRGFFTEMVRVESLVNVPAVPETISSQYSEGCFATWEPNLPALIATITGSARPVEKDNLSDNELAVIVGVRPDGKGAMVFHVEGKENDPPSSEAVEMIQMDAGLPRIRLGAQWDSQTVVPVVRSKLHGHRGVQAYDPAFVEHVFLDPPFYHYPVSCSTEAQANAIFTAFGRSEALQNPQDPRQLVFTVLPGHGVVIVEKWVAGKVPFQAIWEAMDAGWLQIDSLVPQGPLIYEQVGERMVLKERP